MSLRDEITPYLDINGLVAPSFGGGSNNGVLYTSEYIVILNRIGEANQADFDKYKAQMESCMKQAGLLMRSPTNAGGLEAPDDYDGLAAGTSVAAPDVARDVLDYGLHHFGSFNNEDGSWTLKSFLWRQVQIYAAFRWAAGQYVLPPFNIYAAICIALGGWRVPTDSTDPRILAWLLMQVAAPKSFFCRIGAWFFKRRLMKDYPNGMKDVFTRYFGADHPLTKYVPVI